MQLQFSYNTSGGNSDHWHLLVHKAHGSRTGGLRIDAKSEPMAMHPSAGSSDPWFSLIIVHKAPAQGS